MAKIIATIALDINTPVVFFNSIDDSLDTYDLQELATDATVIDEEVMHEWLEYAQGLDIDNEFELQDAPPAEAYTNEYPPIKHLPPHP